MKLFRRRLWLYALVGIPVLTWLLFFVILPALGVCRIYQIPTNSMAPTIVSGDWIMRSDLSYKSAEPQHGDLVIVTIDGLPGASGPVSYIKRVLGLPGDVLTVVNQDLHLNGKPVMDPAGLPYSVMLMSPGTALQNNGNTLTVPAGQFFLVGDNSRNSQDSRMYGCVPRSSIQGKAVLRFWPLSRLGIL